MFDCSLKLGLILQDNNVGTEITEILPFAQTFFKNIPLFTRIFAIEQVPMQNIKTIRSTIANMKVKQQQRRRRISSRITLLDQRKRLEQANKKLRKENTIVQNKKIGVYSPTERQTLLQKFMRKRRKRVWHKTTQYNVRKKHADSRQRDKGRFIVKQQESDSSTSSTKPAFVDAELLLNFQHVSHTSVQTSVQTGSATSNKWIQHNLFQHTKK